MSYGKERVYKKVEVIGVAKESVEAAIQSAVSRAHSSLEGLSWFELQEVRGHIDENGRVSEYQVVVKLSFELK